MPKKQYGGLDTVGAKIINLGDPSASTDAVNLQYLQAFVRGLRWKEPVRVASTGNLTITAPGASIDGVAMVVNDRVLAKNQTTGSENGVWVWNGAAVAMTRALDADSAAEVIGASVLVMEGTTNANKQFNQTTEPVTIGTTTMTWVEFGGGGSSYTAGNGLTLSSNDFNVGAGTGITVAADTVSVDTAVVVRKYAANIGDGSTTAIAVTHSLGTKDITYSIQVVSTGEFIDVDAVATSTTVLTLTFPSAPTSGQYRVVVHA